MHVMTFDNDLLGLSDFAQRLEKFIDVEQRYVPGSLVLALSSKFGSGKTTFLNMWSSEIEARGDEEKPLVIRLNAWESDYYGDPLFAIISGMVDSVKNEGEDADAIIEAAKDVGRFVTAIGSQVVQKFTGIDPVAAGEFAEGKKAKQGKSDYLSADAFTTYQARRDAMVSLQTALKDFVSNADSIVLFLVDELDRCRPDYAISYLETIKHVFDLGGAAFILAVDRDQLENSAKTAFGSDLDFDEYIRKFVHREVALPSIQDSGYDSLAKKYLYQYLSVQEVRYCRIKVDQYRYENIVELISGLKMTPRQIQEIFRVLGHVCETSEKKQGDLRWCFAVGTIAMAVLKIGKPQMYYLLGAGQCDPHEAKNFVNMFDNNRHALWWFGLFFSGGGLTVKSDKPLLEVMEQVGFSSEDSNYSPSEHMDQWFDGWGHSFEDRFHMIYNKIEHIDQWGL